MPPTSAIPCPIHQLPLELLSHTILILLASVEPENYYQHLTNLKLVCKKWNDLVERSPAFWSFINTFLDLVDVERLLEKSRNHPLTIWTPEKALRSRTDNRDQYPEGYDTVLQKCLEHLGRCVSVTGILPAKTWNRSSLEFLPSPAPLLRSLSFKQSPTDGELRLESNLEYQARTQWDSDWPGLPALVDLELNFIKITVSGLVDILASIPTLKCVSLQSLELQKGGVLAGSDTSMITLPGVIKFSTGGMSDDQLRPLLEQILLPSCTRLSLLTRYCPLVGAPRPHCMVIVRVGQPMAPDTPLICDYLLQNVSTTFPKIFPITVPISLSCSDRHVRCRLQPTLTGKYGSTSPMEEPHLDFSIYTYKPGLAWSFTHEFYKQHTTNVPIDLSISTSRWHAPDNLVQLVFRLEETTRLSFTYEGADTLFEYLAKPHCTTASTTWQFPKLEVLCLDSLVTVWWGPRGLSQVSRMIKRRYGEEAQRHGIEPPIPLKKIQIPKPWKSADVALEELRGILGEDAIDFCPSQPPHIPGEGRRDRDSLATDMVQ